MKIKLNLTTEDTAMIIIISNASWSSKHIRPTNKHTHVVDELKELHLMKLMIRFIPVKANQDHDLMSEDIHPKAL